MPSFGAAERRIATLLRKGETFLYHGVQYRIICSGKPTCSKGEPKTDVYVKALPDDGDPIEIKITYKKSNADFLENKTNAERAEALFGGNWENIIIDATSSIRSAFENKKLIFKNSFRRTQRGSITLGWKYEFVNKSGGELSGPVNLTHEQIVDVYAGTHLPLDKRNAAVNGVVIRNSGVATHILMNDNANSIQDVIDNLCTIEEYVEDNPLIYFACKALNYRTFESRYDGNRPLSVYVDWYVKNGQLCHNLIFDSPLSVKGDDVAEKLERSLKMIGVSTTDDITADIVRDPSIINY